MRKLRPIYCAIGLSLLACSSKSPATVDAPASFDAAAPVIDAKPTFDAWGGPKSVPCANTFGQTLTNAFGRLDGTVLAIVPPGDEECMQPNSTHLVIQVTMGGAAYRMVVDVLSSTAGDPNVWLDEVDAPLAGIPWSEGWHTGIPFDYVTNLQLASTDFVSHTQAELVDTITNEINLGDKISVFSTSTGGVKADSSHLVHRNLTNADGAIVLSPDSANAHYILLRFDEQTF